MTFSPWNFSHDIHFYFLPVFKYFSNPLTVNQQDINPLMSLFQASVQSSLIGQTEGLFGTFTNNAADDFIDLTGNVVLGPDPTPQDVYTTFAPECKFAL